MKQFSYMSLVMLVLAGVAIADNCNTGLIYCGSSLLKKGNYQGQLDQLLFDTEEILSGDTTNWLFLCAGGRSGVISLVQKCNVCQDNGTGKDDECIS